MPLPRLLALFLTVPPLLAAIPALAYERLDRAALEQRLDTNEARAARTALQRADATALGLLLQRPLAKAGGDAALDESLRHRALLRLREPGLRGDAATRDAVQGLLAYAPQTWVPPADPDHGRGQWVPAYDLAAAARGTLAVWARQDAEQAARAALRTGDASRLQALDPQAVAAVFAEAAPATLRRLATQADWPPAVRVMLATRLADPALAGTLLADADDATLLDAMGPLTAALPPEAAQAWLQLLAAQRPALASSALLAMAPVAARSASTQDYLLSQLGDAERGASAAQALAAAPTPPVRAALAEVLRAAEDGARLRRALLALRWIDDAASREQLRAFSAAPQAPVALRQEVATWLR